MNREQERGERKGHVTPGGATTHRTGAPSLFHHSPAGRATSTNERQGFELRGNTNGSSLRKQDGFRLGPQLVDGVLG